jgi:hypothetical protein
VAYSSELNKVTSTKKYSQIRAKEKRLKTAIYSHLMDCRDQDLPHNQFITLARLALPSLEASALLRFQKFCRVLRDQANALGRGFSYLWVAAVGAKRGYHIHMTLFWPYRDRSSLNKHTCNFWDISLSPAPRHSARFRSDCSSVYLSPLSIGEQSYENIALYLSAHVSKHLIQPKGRCFGKSIAKNMIV